MAQTTLTTTMKTKPASHQTSLPFAPTWTSAPQLTRLLRLLPTRPASSQRWASSTRRLAGFATRRWGRRSTNWIVDGRGPTNLEIHQLIVASTQMLEGRNGERLDNLL